LRGKHERGEPENFPVLWFLSSVRRERADQGFFVEVSNMATIAPHVRLASMRWRRLGAVCLAVALAVSRVAGAQGVGGRPDSLMVSAIRRMVEAHHPEVLSTQNAAVVWIVVDANYAYRWSAVDGHATPASILARAKHAELSDAVARLRLAEQDSTKGRGTLASARSDLDHMVRELKRYATLADVSRIDVMSLPDFLDAEEMAQSLSTWIFWAGEFGSSPIKVTIIRLKPAGR
jgi:hypothetical protein